MTPVDTTRLAAGHFRVKRLRKLCRKRSERTVQGLFVLHGATLVAEATRSGVDLEEVFVADDAEAELRHLASGTGAPCFEVDAGVLGKALDVVTAQRIAATARIPDGSLDRVLRGDSGLALALMGVSDPGNVGTLIRTAEAAGLNGVLIGPETADPFGPKTVRASAGSIFRVPTASLSEDDLDLVAISGWDLIATVGGEGGPLDEYSWPDAAVLMLGNEANGLADSLTDRADATVTIDCEPVVESLNVATAGAVVMFDWRRRHHTLNGA